MVSSRANRWRHVTAMITKMLWLVATVAVLLISLAIDDRSPGNDAHMFFGFSMIILTGPGGFAVALPATYVLEKLLPGISQFLKSQWGDGLFWAFMAIGGYLQWFVLVPLLIRKGWRLLHRAWNSGRRRARG